MRKEHPISILYFRLSLEIPFSTYYYHAFRTKDGRTKQSIFRGTKQSSFLEAQNIAFPFVCTVWRDTIRAETFYRFIVQRP